MLIPKRQQSDTSFMVLPFGNENSHQTCIGETECLEEQGPLFRKTRIFNGIREKTHTQVFIPHPSKTADEILKYEIGGTCKQYVK